MKPYILNGHTRPIQQVMYNHDGDLLFTCGSDRIVNVWYTDNGERLGSLGKDYGEGTERIKDQHRAVIWTCDVTRDSAMCITGSGDATAKVWDVSTGVCLNTYQFGSSVRSVSASMDGNVFSVAQDRQMTHYCKVFVCDRRIPNTNTEEDVRSGTNASVVRSWRITDDMMMNTKLKFGWMDETIITANEQGVLQKWDWNNVSLNRPAKDKPESDGVGIPIYQINAHDKDIKDLVLNADRTICMTSSKDRKVKMWDCMDDDGFELLRQVEHVTNANSCAFNPSSRVNHIAVAGGDDAKNITTTGGTGNFESYIYNVISQETIGYFKGHFSPVNSIAFHPNGKQITTGSEEGNARINNLDKNYLEYKEPEMELVMADSEYRPIVV